MKLKLFDYSLPKEFIAQRPVTPRDHSRLLVLDRKKGKISHHRFFEIEQFLKPSDVLILNNSKVIPARLWGKKNLVAPRQARGAFGGGKVEVLLLHRVSAKVWEVLIGGKGRKENLVINFKCGLQGKILKKLPGGIWQVQFNYGGKRFKEILKKVGEAPTPPYIKQKSDLKKYQTVYAEKEGSVAAPTAGFHFTKNLINKLKKKGIQFEYVTLHVGFGTFQPVKEVNIEQHKMHPEFVEVKKEVIRRLWEAKKEGRRIVAVGTTSVRVLESVFKSQMGRPRISAPLNLRKLRLGGPASGGNSRLPRRDVRKWINLFIYPGYQFKFVDALITNFHLPRSTLLMLVSAFAGRKRILNAYEVAKKRGYRFYSFGDAMLII